MRARNASSVYFALRGVSSLAVAGALLLPALPLYLRALGGRSSPRRGWWVAATQRAAARI